MTAAAERARAAALTRHSRGTGSATTAAARQGFYARFEREVLAEAQGPLSPRELAIRTDRRLRAHMSLVRAGSLAKRARSLRGSNERRTP